MGHTRRTRETAYQKVRERRLAWFRLHGPCSCGSIIRLELHHKDPALKVSHKIWSWATDRRNAELTKCEVKCRTCHTKHHNSTRVCQHGLARYQKYQCRCAICKAAKMVERRRYLVKKRRLAL